MTLNALKRFDRFIAKSVKSKVPFSALSRHLCLTVRGVRNLVILLFILGRSKKDKNVWKIEMVTDLRKEKIKAKISKKEQKWLEFVYWADSLPENTLKICKYTYWFVEGFLIQKEPSFSQVFHLINNFPFLFQFTRGRGGVRSFLILGAVSFSLQTVFSFSLESIKFTLHKCHCTQSTHPDSIPARCRQKVQSATMKHTRKVLKQKL